jgi:ribosomal protein S27AE
MKVQCPQCREIVEMEDFSTSDAGLRFTCGNCNQTSFLANPHKSESGAERAETAQAAVPDEVICPKCGHAQRDPYACHRCGLVFSKFDQSKLPPDPEEAAALWKEIRLLPADDSLHEAFLDACLKADRLDYAARQYRLMLREPASKATAEKMLERLFAKAQAQLAPVSMAAEGRQGERRQKSKILIWIVLAVFGGLMVYYLISMTDMLSKMSP